jgi:hypothetical protein
MRLAKSVASLLSLIVMSVSCSTGLLSNDPMKHGDYFIDSIQSDSATLSWETDIVVRGVVAVVATKFRYQDASLNEVLGSVSDLVADEGLYTSLGRIKNLGFAGKAIEYSELYVGDDNQYGKTVSTNSEYPGKSYEITGLSPDKWYVLDFQFVLEQGAISGLTHHKFLVFKTNAVN